MSSPLATKIIDFIKPRLNKRSVAFLLSLVLSSVFWLLTSLSKDYVDEVIIPVEYENIPDDYLIANEPITEVTASVKGYGFDLLWYWLNFEEQKITVSANPALLPTVSRNGGRYSYVLTSDKTGSEAKADQDELEVLRIYPDTLFLKFLTKHVKQVPVKLAAKTTYSKQFGVIGNPTLIPDSVFVSGPEAEIDSITAVFTEFQSWENLDESITSEINLVGFSQFPLVQLSQSEVKVEVNVVEFTEGTVSVPLRILAEDSDNVKVYPNQVEVRYLVPLSEYDNVSADQFQVSVNLNEENSKSNSLAVLIDKQPSIVRSVRVVPSQVEYIIQR